jgi:hypothetical protein
MADDIDDLAVMRVPTGLMLTPTLTIDDITARARDQLALVRLGRPELTYLTDPGIVGRSSLILTVDRLDLLVPVPLPQKRTMIPHAGRGRQRDLLGMLGRDDDAQAAAMGQTAERVQRNAELVQRTSHVMNTATDVGAELARIEKEEGVDLQPARHFHRRNRGAMVVGIADREIPFVPVPVRTAVASEKQTEGRLILVGSRNTHTDFRAVMESGVSDLLGDGFKGAKPSTFRIGAMLRWQRIVFDGARHLGLPLLVSTKDAVSTWTLRERHGEIQGVSNWAELLDQVVAVLVEARAGLRRATAP